METTDNVRHLTLELVENGEYSITEPITFGTNDILKTVTINGNGAIFDGQTTQSFITVNYGYTLYLNNLTVKNTVADYGAAINSNGSVIIADAVFENNSAAYNGGAVYSEGALTVTNSNFTNNKMITSPNDGSGVYGGGAICALDEVSVDGCIFDSNVAAYDDEEPSTGGFAGAILLLNNNKDVTILNSVFTKNSGCYGGAITVKTDQGANVLIQGNDFVDNFALSGAAIDTYNTVTVTENNFTENLVRSSATGLSKGGAVSVNGQGYTASITNNNFTDNQAIGGNGGAVYVDEDANHVSSENIYKENKANNAAVFFNYHGTLTSSDDVFIDNDATFEADLIYTDSSDTMLGSASFDASEIITSHPFNELVTNLGDSVFIGSNLNINGLEVAQTDGITI